MGGLGTRRDPDCCLDPRNFQLLIDRPHPPIAPTAAPRPPVISLRVPTTKPRPRAPPTTTMDPWLGTYTVRSNQHVKPHSIHDPAAPFARFASIRPQAPIDALRGPQGLVRRVVRRDSRCARRPIYRPTHHQQQHTHHARNKQARTRTCPWKGPRPT